jgi:hypothetical protein
MSETMVIFYLLLNLGVMRTGTQVTTFFNQYATTQTVPDAELVRDDPVFPQSYRDREALVAKKNARRKW